MITSREYRSAFQAMCRGYAQYGVGQDDMRYIPILVALSISAQYASLEALAALIASEAFHMATSGGQIRVVIPALIQILANSSISLTVLKSKYHPGDRLG